MTSPEAAEDLVVSAALALVAEHGWSRLSMAAVAARAGLPLLDVYRAVPSKAMLPALVVAATDRAVLAGGTADAAESPRDRLFDVLMRRFDALQARRPGMVALMRGLRSDPVALSRFAPRLARSLGWMLEAADIPSGGIVGALRTQALAVVHADALRVWLDDDTPDMAKTMAAVDRGLARLETVVRFLPAGFRVGAPSDVRTPAPPPASEPESA